MTGDSVRVALSQLGDVLESLRERLGGPAAGESLTGLDRISVRTRDGRPLPVQVDGDHVLCLVVIEGAGDGGEQRVARGRGAGGMRRSRRGGSGRSREGVGRQRGHVLSGAPEAPAPGLTQR